MVEVSDITTGEVVDIQTSFTGATKFLNITGSYNLNGTYRCLGHYYDSGNKGVQANISISSIRLSALGNGLTFTDINLIIEYIK